jgi:aspartate racemase
MVSVPHTIEDRTKFLSGESSDNPGIAISKVVEHLTNQGASVIGMPCNTAHSPIIFQEIEKRLPHNITFIHMIQEVVRFIAEQFPAVSNVGILATSGTLNTSIYDDELKSKGLEPVLLSDKEQNGLVDSSIYDPEYGIKSFSSPVTQQAKQNLKKGVLSSIKNSAEVIILGCTEIPLALPESNYNGIPLIDSTAILARALILNSNPDSLKNN